MSQKPENVNLDIENIEAMVNAIVETEKETYQDEWSFARECFPRSDFPWDVLPHGIDASLKQLARSCATSPLSLPGAAMTILSSTIGRKIDVSPKRSWKEPLIFWMVDIRESGEGKTHAARKLCNVLYDAQRQADKEYAERCEEEQAKPPKERKPVPRPKGFYTTSLTLEGLNHELSGHPTGGIVGVFDELSSFISGQNQYKSKGSDRESWLCLWDGKSARIIRAAASVSITGSRVNLFGGTQPKVWKQIFSSDKGIYLDDGTVFRFLPVYGGGGYCPLTDESWSEENQKAWEDTLLFALKWAGNQEETKSIVFDQEARNALTDWRNDLYADMDRLPEPIRGFIPKTISYAIRFSGILHCLEYFSIRTEPAPVIPVKTVQQGIRTATFYMGQTVDAMKALLHDEPHHVGRIPDEQALRLASALERLRPDTDNDRLAVGYIQEAYNADLPPVRQIRTSRAMGGIIRSCGLEVKPGKHNANGKRAVKCLSWNQKTETFLKQSLQCLQSLQSHS
ncbi:hypothetical protein DENIS_3943 [Desulfonema ishimotonii]|uniref:DUF3987 domain-containing protein n=1 Tax=Desulfonema ishimotonii TaxID=45657 RepID=A0A401G145_9BACT|nr:DUF3987 domain-containing protein [Desulfonema ishimotonii]GBC62958.1 hypothetical protein DENIS_3943 [Desulfonema ishimotonii]